MYKPQLCRDSFLLGSGRRRKKKTEKPSAKWWSPRSSVSSSSASLVSNKKASPDFTKAAATAVFGANLASNAANMARQLLAKPPPDTESLIIEITETDPNSSTRVASVFVFIFWTTKARMIWYVIEASEYFQLQKANIRRNLPIWQAACLVPIGAKALNFTNCSNGTQLLMCICSIFSHVGNVVNSPVVLEETGQRPVWRSLVCSLVGFWLRGRKGAKKILLQESIAYHCPAKWQQILYMQHSSKFRSSLSAGGFCIPEFGRRSTARCNQCHTTATQVLRLKSNPQQFAFGTHLNHVWLQLYIYI